MTFWVAQLSLFQFMSGWDAKVPHPFNSFHDIFTHFYPTWSLWNFSFWYVLFVLKLNQAFLPLCQWNTHTIGHVSLVEFLNRFSNIGNSKKIMWWLSLGSFGCSLFFFFLLARIRNLPLRLSKFQTSLAFLDALVERRIWDFHPVISVWRIYKFFIHGFLEFCWSNTSYIPILYGSFSPEDWFLNIQSQQIEVQNFILPSWSSTILDMSYGCTKH